MALTHHQVKQQQGATLSKNKNTITDADYIMRDIGTEEDTAKNIIDITPPEFKAKPEVKKTKAEKE